MAKPHAPLLVTLDCGLTYGLQKMLLSLLAVGLSLLGLIGLVLAYRSCFEHGRGLLELSRFEIIAFVLFIALERRFTYYNRLFGYGFWKGCKRLFSVLGWATLLVGVAALLNERRPLPVAPILLQPLWLMTYLLALYLCAPAGFIKSATRETAHTPVHEPVLDSPDMESK